MKSGWQTKTMGEICGFVRGPFGGSLKKSIFVEAGFAVYEQQHAIYDQFDEIRYFIDDVKFKAMQRFALHPNDLIMSCSGTMGKVAIVPDNIRPGIINQALLKLTPSKAVSATFLKHWMYSTDFQSSLKEQSGGAAIQNVASVSLLKEIKMPLPPLSEQRRIVGILDEAFDAIATAKANAEKNLRNARELFESHLENVFTRRGDGWAAQRLSDLCEIKHGFAFRGEFFTDEGDYVVLTPGNFFESGGYRDRKEKQKYYFGDIPSGFVLAEGDMLVAMTEQAAGLLGSPIIVPESDKFLHNQRLGLVIKKPGIPWTNEFFFHVFNTKAVRGAIHESASGVKVRHTSPAKIGAVVVSFPVSIAEQRAVVSQLDALVKETQHLESIYRRKLAALDELKKSLLHQAFCGNL
ncbi:MAG: restriction endonuclease subunit S [Desulfobacteraceae bacterium]|nr:restriction endonuclease subunit S [Desulfobacteraceae bacterium]